MSITYTCSGYSGEYVSISNLSYALLKYHKINMPNEGSA